MEFSKELLAKAKSAQDSAALLAFAKENGIPMTQEEADGYFAKLHKKGELSDQELENVTGGGCGGGPKRNKEGFLIVEERDFCQMWECKVHRTSDFMYLDVGGKWYAACPRCSRYVMCAECYYGKRVDGQLCCYNPSK